MSTPSPAIDGVDCLWVGHFDLSVSLGIPGEFDHPNFTAAMDKIIAAAKKHNKSLGRLVPNVEQGIDIYKPRASISSATRATSGCCTTRWPTRIGKLRDGCKIGVEG